MLAIAYGTRPEWLKVKPVIEELKKQNIEHIIINVRQHTTLLPKDALYDRQIFISEGGRNRLDDILESVLRASEDVLEDVSSLMVQGDTATVFGMALKAFHRKIPVIHLEAGMRTWDQNNPYPEETYRQMVTAIARYHLTPSYQEKEYLWDSLNYHDKVHICGNTSLDNLKNLKRNDQNQVLITLHRRENKKLLPEWISEINKIAETEDKHFIFVRHPNMKLDLLKQISDKIEMKQPMQHAEFLEELLKCSYVITDSGGLQEETCFLKIPCAVCRKETEREAALGLNCILIESPKNLCNIKEEFDALQDYDECPYGDGHAAEKVVDALKKWELI